MPVIRDDVDSAESETSPGATQRQMGQQEDALATSPIAAGRKNASGAPDDAWGNQLRKVIWDGFYSWLLDTMFVRPGLLVALGLLTLFGVLHVTIGFAPGWPWIVAASVGTWLCLELATTGLIRWSDRPGNDKADGVVDWLDDMTEFVVKPYVLVPVFGPLVTFVVVGSATRPTTGAPTFFQLASQVIPVLLVALVLELSVPNLRDGRTVLRDVYSVMMIAILGVGEAFALHAVFLGVETVNASATVSGSIAAGIVSVCVWPLFRRSS